MMGFFGQDGSALRGRPRFGPVEDKPIEDSEPDDTSILSVILLFFLIVHLLRLSLCLSLACLT